MFLLCYVQGSPIEGTVYAPRHVQAALLFAQDGPNEQGHGHDPRHERDVAGKKGRDRGRQTDRKRETDG